MSTVTDTVEKYNDSFTFDSYGNNSWSSVKTTLIYRDKQNNKFCVEFDNNSAIDNYGSILYDKEIQQDLQKGTNSENKVFADTSLLYFGLNEKWLYTKCWGKERAYKINLKIFKKSRAYFPKIR